MVDLNAILVPISILSAGAAAVAILSAYRMQLHQRQIELKRVCAALDDFYDSAALVMDDPAVPQRVRETVAKLSLVIGDREAARSFARWIADFSGCDAKKDKPIGERAEIKAELNSLNEQQVENVTRTIISGMYVLLYRWPETAKIARDMLVPLTVNQRERVDLIAKARAALGKDNDRLSFGNFAPAG